MNGTTEHTAIRFRLSASRRPESGSRAFMAASAIGKWTPVSGGVLTTSPENARAFELVTEVWDDAANLRRIVPHVQAKPRRAFHARWAIAAAACAAVLALCLFALGARSNGISTGRGEQRLVTLRDGTRVF